MSSFTTFLLSFGYDELLTYRALYDYVNAHYITGSNAFFKFQLGNVIYIHFRLASIWSIST